MDFHGQADRSRSMSEKHQRSLRFPCAVSACPNRKIIVHLPAIKHAEECAQNLKPSYDGMFTWDWFDVNCGCTVKWILFLQLETLRGVRRVHIIWHNGRVWRRLKVS